MCSRVRHPKSIKKYAVCAEGGLRAEAGARKANGRMVKGEWAEGGLRGGLRAEAEG